MKTKGLVFRGAFALPLLFASLCPAEDLVELPSVEQALATATEFAPSFEDSSVETVAFHSQMRSCRNPYCFASAEMLFLGINADTGGGITASFDDSDTAGTEISFITGTGLEDFGLAPRVVLGRQISEKWAVAGRYFHLSDHEDRFPTLSPGTTPLATFGTYTENDQVELYSIDLEAIRSFNPGKTKIDASFGARQGSLDVDSALHSFGVITTGNFVNLNLSNGCAFDGAGVLGGLFFRRQIGDSPVQFFFGGRTSKMWGHSDSFGRSAGAVASSPSAPLVGAATVTRNNAESELEINEFQIGLQFDFAMRQLPATAFFRVAYEHQEWDLSGPPTGGAGFGGTIGGLTTNSFSSAGLGNTELNGLALGTGFTW